MREVTYLAAFAPQPEGGFTVTFPDVEGAISEADSFEEAVANAREALELILEALHEDGEAAPKSRADERAIKRILKAGALPALITASAPSKAVRINVTIDEGVLDRVDRSIAETGQSRSGFLTAAARAALRDKN